MPFQKNYARTKDTMSEFSNTQTPPKKDNPNTIRRNEIVLGEEELAARQAAAEKLQRQLNRLQAQINPESIDRDNEGNDENKSPAPESTEQATNPQANAISEEPKQELRKSTLNEIARVFGRNLPSNPQNRESYFSKKFLGFYPVALDLEGELGAFPLNQQDKTNPSEEEEKEDGEEELLKSYLDVVKQFQESGLLILLNRISAEAELPSTQSKLLAYSFSPETDKFLKLYILTESYLTSKGEQNFQRTKNAFDQVLKQAAELNKCYIDNKAILDESLILDLQRLILLKELNILKAATWQSKVEQVRNAYTKVQSYLASLDQIAKENTPDINRLEYAIIIEILYIFGKIDEKFAPYLEAQNEIEQVTTFIQSRHSTNPIPSRDIANTYSAVRRIGGIARFSNDEIPSTAEDYIKELLADLEAKAKRKTADNNFMSTKLYRLMSKYNKGEELDECTQVIQNLVFENEFNPQRFYTWMKKVTKNLPIQDIKIYRGFNTGPR